MHLTSHESLNRRLGGTPFIGNDADRAFFGALIMDIERLKRPGDDITLPHVNEAGAWAKAFAIYQQLEERSRTPTTEQVASEQLCASVATVGATWNRFLQHRTMMLEYARRGDINEEVCRYLELETGDLGPISSDDPEAARYGGRPANWSDRAYRVDVALTRWEAMPQSEKLAIPQVMAARRAESGVSELRQRMAALENATRRDSAA